MKPKVIYSTNILWILTIAVLMFFVGLSLKNQEWIDLCAMALFLLALVTRKFQVQNVILACYLFHVTLLVIQNSFLNLFLQQGYIFLILYDLYNSIIPPPNNVSLLS